MGNSNSPGVAPADIIEDSNLSADDTASEPPVTPEHQPKLDLKLDGESYPDRPLKTATATEISSASYPLLPDVDLPTICVSTSPATLSLLPPSEPRPLLESSNSDDSLSILDADLPICFDMPDPSALAPEQLPDFRTSNLEESGSEQHSPMVHVSPTRHADAHVIDQPLCDTISSPIARLPSPSSLPPDETGKPTIASITEFEQPFFNNKLQPTSSTLLESTFENHTPTVLSITTKEPTPIGCSPVPLATTYADATNLAARFPDFASEILVNPISSASGSKLTPQQALANVRQKGYLDTHTPFDEIMPAVLLPQSAITSRPVHTAAEPNWALAPPDVKCGSTATSSGPLNKRERKESEEHYAKRSRDSNSDHNQDHGSKEYTGRRRPRKRVARAPQPQQDPRSRRAQGPPRPVRLVHVSRGNKQRHSSDVSHNPKQEKDVGMIELGELFRKALKMQRQQHVDDLATGAHINVAAVEATKPILQAEHKAKSEVDRNGNGQMGEISTTPSSHPNFVTSSSESGTNPSNPKPTIFSPPPSAALGGKNRATSNEKASNDKVVNPEWRRASESTQGRDTQRIPRYVPPPIVAARGVHPSQTSPFGSDANFAAFGRFVASKTDMISVQDTVLGADRPTVSATAGFKAQKRVEPDVDAHPSFHKDLASVVFDQLEASKIASQEAFLFHSRGRKDPNAVLNGIRSNGGSVSRFDAQQLDPAPPSLPQNHPHFGHGRNGHDGSFDPFSSYPKQAEIAPPSGSSSKACDLPQTVSRPVLVENPQPQCDGQIVSARPQRTSRNEPVRSFASFPNSIALVRQGYQAWDAQDTLYASGGIIVQEQSKTPASGLSPVVFKRPAQDQNREGGFDTVAGISGLEKTKTVIPSTRPTDAQLQASQKQNLVDRSDIKIEGAGKLHTFGTLRPLLEGGEFEFLPAGMGSDEQVKMFPSLPGPLGSRRSCRRSRFDLPPEGGVRRSESPPDL